MAVLFVWEGGNMDIYLSVNNRADIMKIPVLPPTFTILKPQSTETFETVSQGDLQLIGVPKLKGITIQSFFPVKDYPYLRDISMKGWEYIDGAPVLMNRSDLFSTLTNLIERVEAL